MSEQKKKHVELEKLRLGMDGQGRIHVGEVDEEGKLKSDRMKDVTGDFQRLMQIQMNLLTTAIKDRMKGMQKEPKIEIVHDLSTEEAKKLRKGGL